MPGKTIKLCNCNRTLTLDGARLGKALGHSEALVVHDALCRHEAVTLGAALDRGEEVVVACTQEARLFESIADAHAKALPVKFFNIREHGGWSIEAGGALPKIAALIAAAQLDPPEPVPVVSYKSAGALLIIGPGKAVLQWAERLRETLHVSVLVTDASAELPVDRAYPVFSGELAALRGYLGAFDVEWRQANPIDVETCVRCNACIYACPESAIDFSYQIDLDKCRDHRDCVAACGDIKAIDFERTATHRSGRFDLILDLSAKPFLTMHLPPQGYFAPGDDPVRLAHAVVELCGAVGEFEKPRYFTYRAEICAHSRSQITGCNQCVEVCSTQAISPDGDHVKVEPHLCMGCGACATVCPSGAMGYAYPRVSDLGTRIKTLLTTYRAAGGRDALLLLHNATGGRELIARAARRGKGLPARAIPLQVHHPASVGMDLLLGAIALGASQVVVLIEPDESPDYLAAMRAQQAITQTILHGLGYTGVHFDLLAVDDVDVFAQRVREFQPAVTAPPATFALGNDKRTTLEFAFEHLVGHAPEHPAEIGLPQGSPWGRVEVDRDTCTLCMACVGACPVSALLDSTDRPCLRFIERNCVQCGLCEKTCPENAIRLTPRLLTGPERKQERVLNEAEPFCCVVCGKPFATRQLIDGMSARLAGHSMFRDGAALRRIRMCADCRVKDMMKAGGDASIFDYQK